LHWRTWPRRYNRSGRTLLLCGAREQPARLIHQAGFEAHVGRENIVEHVQAALERARALHDARPAGSELPH
jgi:SulP family sulfate permease